MQSANRSRTIIYFGIAIAILGLAIGISLLVHNRWIVPRDSAAQAQTRVNHRFREQGIDGRANALFYFQRVEFHGRGISSAEVLSVKPILDEIPWLKLVDVTDTSVTCESLATLKKAFQPVLVLHRDCGISSQTVEKRNGNAGDERAGEKSQ